MLKQITLASTLVLLTACSAFNSDRSGVQISSVTIGSGGEDGYIYQVSGNICRHVNDGIDDHAVNCTHTAGGSLKNIKGIRAGDLDTAIVPSDWLYYAREGYNTLYYDEPYEDLRALFSMEPSAFTLVARADSGITSFEDLQGKRVNVGSKTSLVRKIMEAVIEKKGLTMDSFELITELNPVEQLQALCDNKIDAMVESVGFPSGRVNEATSSCNSILIPVTGEQIDKLIEENSYFARVTIPGGTYTGTDSDTVTFGVGSMLVTSTTLSEETVYKFVAAVFGNFKKFKELDTSYEILNEPDMITKHISAPFHPGAIKYYKERGWM